MLRILGFSLHDVENQTADIVGFAYYIDPFGGSLEGQCRSQRRLGKSAKTAERLFLNLGMRW